MYSLLLAVYATRVSCPICPPPCFSCFYDAGQDPDELHATLNEIEIWDFMLVYNLLTLLPGWKLSGKEHCFGFDQPWWVTPLPEYRDSRLEGVIFEELTKQASEWFQVSLDYFSLA